MESLDIFALLPSEKSSGANDFKFFYFPPLSSLNLALLPGKKLDWSPGHLDMMFG